MDLEDELQTSPIDFHHLWNRVANKDTAVATATFGTIGYPEPAGTSDNGAEALPRVDQLVKLGAVLGIGGNGEVRAAQQTTLHRTIAVKKPKEGRSLAARLLREARIIGYLEHPSIPPVHFVGVGEQSELLVGLKHIEGETFGERLERERPLENLDQNLEILVQVSNAVDYAHSRGVVHLDIKPDNVMTGRFGEVYLLDWGLATSFDGRSMPDMFEAQPNQARGTPAFMAPEMIIGEKLSPSTDVYLLGGLLHYVLTHKPPNAGNTALEAMRSAYEPPSDREFPSQVPTPLAEICQRALAADPANRYPNADAFRAALNAYRSAREQIDAVAVATQQLSELRDLLSRGEATAAAAYQMYGAARQTLDAATRVQASADSIGPLRQSMLEAMIDWELARGNASGAELLASELPEANAAIVKRIEKMTTEQKLAARELDALRMQFDQNFGAKTKALTVTAIGLTIALLEVAAFALDVGATPERVLGGYIIYIASLAAVTFAARRTLFGTLSNKAASLNIWLLTAFGLTVRLGALSGLLTVPSALGYDLVLVTLINVLVALLFDRRLLVSSPTYAIGAFAIFGWPDYATVIFGITHFIGLSSIGIAVSQRTRSTS